MFHLVRDEMIAERDRQPTEIGGRRRSWWERAFSILTWALLASAVLWSFGALYYFDPLPPILRLLLRMSVLIGAFVVFARMKHRWAAKAIVAATCLTVFVAWCLIRPHLNHEWIDLHQTVASIKIEGDEVTIENMRWATYRSESDYDIEYVTRKFQIDQLEEVWYFVQRFTELDSLAHTFLGFGYRTEKGMEYFGVSVEIRCEPGEVFSPTKGIFKQYELMYTISDERDSIGYRTHCRRNDRLYMYRCNATASQVQDMFRDIAERVSKLENRPEFYHTLTNNCTNNIVMHANQVGTRRVRTMNPRVVFPGYSARKAYQLGIIGEQGESFEALQRRSRVDPIARQFPLDDEFSRNLRAALENSAQPTGD